MSFEIKDRDAGARIGKWLVRTPNIAVVVNPHKMIIPIKKLKKLGVDLLITNAYILSNSEHKQEILEKGIHKFLGWKGPVYTDSGTYQMYSKGSVRITPEETISFQQKIKSNIITPLDEFTLPTDSKETAKKKLEETMDRIKLAKLKTKNELLVGPIQGGIYPDLRKQACKELSLIDPDVYAIGGIVPLMESYNFKELTRIILTCKKNLNPDKPVHAFGAGHPMIFPLLALLGVDLFDSAAYSLYAQGNRYLTSTGTIKKEKLKELPCSCPVCIENKPEQLSTELLAEHNLNATLEEIRTIRQAIIQGNLWELAENRCRNHPNLMEAYKLALKEYEYFKHKDPVRKRTAFFKTSELSNKRPDIKRAVNNMKIIPRGLDQTWPFGQSIGINWNYNKKTVNDLERLRTIADYQFRKGAGKQLFPNNIRIEKSKKTEKIRRAWLGNELLCTLRPQDGFLALQKKGAERILRFMKKAWIDPEIKDYAKQGSDIFTKFITQCDDLIPREEIAVMTDNEFLNIGEALLNKGEILVFEKGVAVKAR